ncbi:MAG: GSCFA domain-containing protein [Alphaproteobacteria bacterium]|nr:GSCFA domain-containing protein [Alphaproteobacteria bacterium]
MAKTPHPYKQQPDRAFWRKTVEDHHSLDISEWYRRKFPISNAKIAAAGSCFAQHIGRELREKGFHFLDVEPAPPLLRKDRWLDYGYGMYSARYGNVYTPRQLLQLAQRALGEFKPHDHVWKKDRGFVDPFRPTIEPQPMLTIDEVEVSRKHHLARVASLFETADVFVFTLGLTEAWQSKKDGAVFPVAPGVSGGEFDDGDYGFVNLSYGDCANDLRGFIDRMRVINNRMQFLLTVSPVPLMATATQQQVVVATTYSKSVLRAVAGRLSDNLKFVDYFPSFEIISSHVMGGQFYQPDRRGVAQYGVDHVMRQFFLQHPPQPKTGIPAAPAPVDVEDGDEVHCDEELLAAFGERETA